MPVVCEQNVLRTQVTMQHICVCVRICVCVVACGGREEKWSAKMQLYAVCVQLGTECVVGGEGREPAKMQTHFHEPIDSACN